MNLVEQALLEVLPEKKGFDCSIQYTRRFRGYNANIRMRGSAITINASASWRGVSAEIQKGLFQELFVRLFKVKKQTICMDLYHNFIKSLPRVASKVLTHPVLEGSFNRVNDAFFGGLMERPNLRVGNGVNRLGTYEYATDTVTISGILLENESLMDYVMYHELLHKKHQYTARSGRTAHHSRKFREEERKFPDAEALEKELNRLVRRHKTKLSFW